MSTLNVIVKKRNPTDTGWDTLLPITTAENVMMNEAQSLADLSIDALYSYFAWCANVNIDSVESAFGKNNEEYIKQIGKQLAMYAWYKGNSKTTYPFTNLMLANTLEETLSDIDSREELGESLNLLDLLALSPYALSVAKPYMPTPDATPEVVVVGSLLTATAATLINVETDLVSVVAPYSGVYTAHPRACAVLTADTYHLKLYRNTTLLKDVTANSDFANWPNTSDLTFSAVAGDVIKLTAKSDGSGKTWQAIGLVLTADREVADLSGIAVGNLPLFIKPATGGYTTATVIPFYTCPTTKTYRVYLSGWIYTAPDVAKYALYKNGVVVSVMDPIGQFYDVACTAGDILQVRLYSASTASRVHMMAICGVSNPNVFPVV